MHCRVILMRPDSSVSRIHIGNIRHRNPKFGKNKFSVSFCRNVVDLDPEVFEYIGCGSGYGSIMRSLLLCLVLVNFTIFVIPESRDSGRLFRSAKWSAKGDNMSHRE